MHYSPQVALLQCLSSCALTAFYIHHSWCYDRFDSLNLFKIVKGNKSRESFKRVMIYLYILGSPSFAVQGGMYAWIKYKVGFLPLAQTGMPVPYHFWPVDLQRLIMPLQYLNAFAWWCELVVHLEELMFFLHLISLTPSSAPWFKSWYFRIVAVGSITSIGVLFGPVIAYKDDPLRAEAVVYLSGSSFVLLSNFIFFRVFYVFPGFLANLKMAGGTSEVVIRLKTFHELNKIRVASRFFFGIPLFILSVDGLTGKTLNSSLFWTDCLLFMGMIAFGVQACCTLLIFLPRNIAKEAGVTRATNSVDQGMGSGSNVAVTGGFKSFSASRKGSLAPTCPPNNASTLGLPVNYNTTAFPPSSFTPTSRIHVVLGPNGSPHPVEKREFSEDDEKVEGYRFGSHVTVSSDLEKGDQHAIQLHGGEIPIILDAPAGRRPTFASNQSTPSYPSSSSPLNAGAGGTGSPSFNRRPSLPWAIRNFTSPIDIV